VAVGDEVVAAGTVAAIAAASVEEEDSVLMGVDSVDGAADVVSNHI